MHSGMEIYAKRRVTAGARGPFPEAASKPAWSLEQATDVALHSAELAPSSLESWPKGPRYCVPLLSQSCP